MNLITRDDRNTDAFDEPRPDHLPPRAVDASSHSARADGTASFMFGSGPNRRYVGTAACIPARSTATPRCLAA
jgi:hypothetical protein